MLATAGAGALVAAITLLWLAFLFSVMRSRSKYLVRLDEYAWVLPTMCGVWTVIFVITISLLVTYKRDPDAAFVSAFSSRWVNVGWNDGLVFMGLHISNWYAYLLVLLYQTTRCILGSLLANAFQPYINVLQGSIGKESIKNKMPLILARFSVDLFSFVTSLTDLILYVAQLDISLISFFVTALTNAVSTYYVLKGSPKERFPNALGEPELQPLFMHSDAAARRGPRSEKENHDAETLTGVLRL